MGRVCVSSCRCCVFVSVVNPVLCLWVMSSLISVMSPLLVCALCLSYGGLVGYFLCVLALCVCFVSCIVMMSGWVLCTSF